MGKETWVEIARTGTFTDSAGRPQTFTAEDLDAIARSYDPDRRDAPLVFGHPHSDAAPAFGWVDRLKSEDGRLLAQFRRVPEEVRALVDAGHYRHVSMSLMPDRVTLRHVALLGAAQPAIDGLKAVQFADGAGAITVDFAAITKGDDAMTMEDLQRQIGQLQAQIEALKKELADAEEGKSDAERARECAEKQAAEVDADFAAYRERVEGERREARVAGLVKAGKVTPAEKADVLAFAASLASVAAPVEFTAPDGKKELLSLEEKYFRGLEARAASPLLMEFAAPAPAHAVPPAEPYSAADMAAKL